MKSLNWKSMLPLLLGIIIAFLPVPQGLTVTAWYYFAIFAAVILALILEPMPAAAIGFIGVFLVAVLGLAGPKPADSIRWALSGFSNTTVWLIFGAFMFALGYEKTGLGRRIALVLVRFLGKSTLGLGYAIAFADLTIAPFTPSNTARSAGTIFPIIRNIPGLYGSAPGDPGPVYFGSAYVNRKDFWTLGLIFGFIFLVVLLAVGTPCLLAINL